MTIKNIVCHKLEVIVQINITKNNVITGRGTYFCQPKVLSLGLVLGEKWKSARDREVLKTLQTRISSLISARG